MQLGFAEATAAISSDGNTCRDDRASSALLQSSQSPYPFDRTITIERCSSLGLWKRRMSGCSSALIGRVAVDVGELKGARSTMGLPAPKECGMLIYTAKTPTGVRCVR